MAKNQELEKSKRRILIVSQHFWPESFRINDISDFFVEKGYDIEVLCGLPNYPTGRLFDGYSIFRNRVQDHQKIHIRRALEIPRGSNTSLRIFLNYVSFPLTSIGHIPRLLTKQFDSIFLYQTSPVLMTIAGILIGKIKKTETTMYVLDLWPENLYSVLPIRNHFLRSIAENISVWHYKKTDKLIVLSERMKASIIEKTGKPESAVIVLPQSCEKIYETNIHDKNIADRFSKKFNIVFTGSITPAQSFDTLINAAAILKKQGFKDINWIIVGDGMSRKQVEGAVNKAGLSAIFHFEGQKPIEDMPKYADIADVLIGCLVKSDLLEATVPAKVMSYIALGKPLVLAMDGEVQELINNTIQCGFVGPTEDSKRLATNIQKVYNLPPKEREAMGKRGRKYHFKHFERSIILNKLVTFMSHKAV